MLETVRICPSPYCHFASLLPLSSCFICFLFFFSTCWLVVLFECVACPNKMCTRCCMKTENTCAEHKRQSLIDQGMASAKTDATEEKKPSEAGSSASTSTSSASSSTSSSTSSSSSSSVATPKPL